MKIRAIGTSTGTTYMDSTVASRAAYVYRVRAADAQGNTSGSSNARLAVAKTFTDPTLVSGVTLVKAAHVTELRDAINQVRTLAGLPQASWSAGVAQVQTIYAVHVEELRTALTQALQALSLTVPGFTDAAIFGVTIKKLHIEELRAALNSSGAGYSGGAETRRLVGRDTSTTLPGGWRRCRMTRASLRSFIPTARRIIG